jgi:hypothetical protein
MLGRFKTGIAYAFRILGESPAIREVLIRY